ncbi:hypothetical protein H257_02079 [Aphanomyces astaci]|uniref:Uncharacterized protein n=1 Tax=Aphanomyces astaci TaxID=112090 RepID=W4H5B6_APHAT|nr:hypothetical protein H257_02079 [Aphanomyces astaci]ETV87077.1 hypothetical protein H257_02079 [Aphanomyces astaci]|eukprot:XP_009823876.1 hypothetical protein H257_02079 [Aphanomyces astaci]
MACDIDRANAFLVQGRRHHHWHRHVRARAVLHGEGMRAEAGVVRRVQHHHGDGLEEAVCARCLFADSRVGHLEHTAVASACDVVHDVFGDEVEGPNGGVVEHAHGICDVVGQDGVVEERGEVGVNIEAPDAVESRALVGRTGGLGKRVDPVKVKVKRVSRPTTQFGRVLHQVVGVLGRHAEAAVFEE